MALRGDDQRLYSFVVGVYELVLTLTVAAEASWRLDGQLLQAGLPFETTLRFDTR